MCVDKAGQKEPAAQVHVARIRMRISQGSVVAASSNAAFADQQAAVRIGLQSAVLSKRITRRVKQRRAQQFAGGGRDPGVQEPANFIAHLSTMIVEAGAAAEFADISSRTVKASRPSRRQLESELHHARIVHGSS